MQLKKNIAFITALCLNVSLFSQDSGCTYSVKGQVIDSSHTEPLELAQIEVLDHKNRRSSTDKNGMFELKNLCTGMLELHVSHQHCEHLDFHLLLTRDTFIVIYLKHVEQEFEGFRVVGQSRLPRFHTITAKRLENMKANSVTGLMQELSGVTQLSTGPNIAKPVVNGLHSNRVIIVNNGIRQEGQNWGLEHAPEIDPFLVQEIEFLKGAEALRYGADGIGGVIHVKPASIFSENSGRISGQFNALGSSNGRAGTISGFAGNRISAKIPFYWRLQGTIQRTGNIRAPDYFLTNTGKKEQNYSVHAGYRIKRLKTELFYSRFDNTTGIFLGSHVGSLQDLQAAINSERPLVSSGFSYKIGRPFQDVSHHLMKLKNEISLNARNNLEMTVSYQKNHRQEYDLLRSASSFSGPSFDYYLNTYGGELIWIRNDFHKLNFKAGVSANHQANAYTGRYFVPGFYQDGGAAFFMASRQAGKIRYEGALRYDLKHLRAYLWNNNSLHVADRRFNAATYLLMVSWQAYKHSKFTVSHASSWRPPAPNELYSNGLHQGLASIEVGDASMRPERSFNQSVAYLFNSKTSYFEGEVFYKYLDGFINLVPSLTPQLTIRGAFPVFRYEQVDAGMYGLNFIFKKTVYRYFFVSAKGNLVFADDLSAGTPLSQIPPLSGSSGAGFTRNGYSIHLFGQFAARQNRYVENSDYKTPPPAYAVFGMESTVPLSIARHPARLHIIINNLSNTRYRDYLNRFRYFTDEQGFNLTLRLVVPLDITIKTIKNYEN